MSNDENVLDDPIWNALCGSQAKYSIGGETAKRYQRDVVLSHHLQILSLLIGLL